MPDDKPVAQTTSNKALALSASAAVAGFIAGMAYITAFVVGDWPVAAYAAVMSLIPAYGWYHIHSRRTVYDE